MRVAIKFTDDQSLAINASGTVLVSAAAGSGKTAVLTERVARIICDRENGIDADKLLIVTFTNAAAAELRARIAARIYDISLEHIGDPYYSKQKMLLQSAKICSIDAFCLDLVRKNFSVLGVEPDFSLIDNAMIERYSNKVLDEILLRFYAVNDPDFDFLGRVFGVDSGEKRLKEAILKIYDYAITLPQPKKWLESAVSRYSNGRDGYRFYTEQLLSDCVSEIDEALSLCTIASREVIGIDIEAKLIEFYSVSAQFLRELKKLISEEKFDEAIEFSGGFSLPSVTVRGCKESPEVIELIRDFNKKITTKLKSVIAVCISATPNDDEIENGRVLVSKLCELVSLFYDEFFLFLKSKKMFTFSMVEHLALELLCSEENGTLVPSELSKDICKNYECVLVDEYQDNNDLQDALFFSVSNGGKNLFMVGDVKQCVYGFRNANPDNFLRYKNTFPLYSEGNEKSKIIFKNNFRSRKGVCDFVNAFCNTVMLESVSGMAYTKEDELVASAEFPETDKVTAEVYLCNNASKSKNASAEAEEIALYIKKTMQEGAIIRDGELLRPAKYSDFAILLRSPKSRHTIYESALKRHNIPVSVMSDSFADSPEVMAVISLLKTINNPSRDIPLAAVMTSAFFGFTYDDLVSIKQNSRTKGLYSAVLSTSENGNEKCRKFLEVLSDMKSRAAIEPLGRFISDVCEEYLIAAIYGHLSDFDTVCENINKIISLADAHYSVYGNDLESFVTSLEKQSDVAADSLSGAVDAVRITSFHKSKGLQFPICIVAGIGCKFPKMDLRERYVFSNVFGISVKQPGEKGFKTTAAGDVIMNHRLKQLISEEIRIFYVALTRAEDRLVLFGTSKDLKKDIISANMKLPFCDIEKQVASVPSVTGASGFLDLLILSLIMQADGSKILSYAGLNPLATADTVKFKVTIAEICEPVEGKVAAAVEQSEKTQFVSDPELRSQIEERFGFVYPFRNECLTPSKFAVTELVHGESKEYAFNGRSAFLSKSGLTPAQRGTAMHKFMQFADFKAACEDPEAELERLKEWEFLSEEEAGAIDLRYIRMFFESDMYERFLKANSLYREYKFMVEYPYNEGMTIIQGIADCIFEEDDGLVIFDFKTDSVNTAEELIDRYKKQLDIYKYAIESVFKKPVKECVLFALKLGKYVSF